MDHQKQFIALQEKAEAMRALVSVAEVLKQPSIVSLLLEEALTLNREMQMLVTEHGQPQSTDKPC